MNANLTVSAAPLSSRLSPATWNTALQPRTFSHVSYTSNISHKGLLINIYQPKTAPHFSKKLFQTCEMLFFVVTSFYHAAFTYFPPCTFPHFRKPNSPPTIPNRLSERNLRFALFRVLPRIRTVTADHLCNRSLIVILVPTQTTATTEELQVMAQSIFAEAV